MIQANKNKAFTLVELLAVIVILAIILVIAVPKVMSVIEDAKKATLESTAKMIASSAEKAKVQNTILGNTDVITCDSVAKTNRGDYANCDITFDNNTAKVTIVGGGKFEGLYVCNGTKTSATAQNESCTPVVNAVNFANDDWSTIVAAVQSENYPYQVGDTKTVDMGDLGVHTIRVANTTKCSEVTVESKTACGFVLEFADIIENAIMNESGTNLGGWPASEMRTYVNSTIYNALPEELRNGIISTYVVSSYGSNKTNGVVENENAGVLASELYWSNDKLYLLSTEEVWGTSFTDKYYKYDKSNGTSRQLDYYEDNNVTTSSYSLAIKNNSSGSGDFWWLRAANSYFDDTFFGVNTSGGWDGNFSYYGHGVSPAFRLAE